jgi:hypothetical protein
MLSERKANKKTLVTNSGLFALKRSRAGFFFFLLPILLEYSKASKLAKWEHSSRFCRNSGLVIEFGCVKMVI